MREWPSVIKQFPFKNNYNSDLGYNLKEKLWNNQQFNALNVYKNIDADSADTLELLLEWGPPLKIMKRN